MLGALGALVTTMSLVACTAEAPGDAPPSASTNTAPTPLPPEVAEPILWEAMPAGPEGFPVVDFSGLDSQSFGSDWSTTDYDALRTARVGRTFESPGWADFTLGPSFAYDIEILVLATEADAGDFITEVAAAARHPYDDTIDGVKVEYTPLEAPSGRWPHGTAEMNRSLTWPTGERAVGSVNYYVAGAVVLVVGETALPGDIDAARAHLGTVIPSLVGAVDALPERLEAAR